jgi:Caspase domain
MSSRLFALLIGIGDYAPNRFPDGDSCPNLTGAVGDVEAVAAFLRDRFELPHERVVELTAAPDASACDPRRRPTYENIVAAFRQITRAAAPGDHVYIHYSGHGARTPTLFPELKGESGWDECLAPCDICLSETRYLRDVELGLLLHRMTARGLSVTIVLDSCHSGGATRGRTGAVARGKTRGDRTVRPAESEAGTREELVDVWRRLYPAGLGGPGWLPPADGYVLLAACRERERAMEMPFPDGEQHGALTYWLLDILRRQGTGLTCRQLHGLLVARIHGRLPQQTPVLLGGGDQPFLGVGSADVVRAAEVLPIEVCGSVLVIRLEKGQLLLNTGKSQGVRVKDQFNIFPPGAPLDRSDLRQAVVEVRQAGSTESWAEVVLELSPDPIEPGAQAVLTAAGPLSLQRSVAVVPRTEGAPIAAEKSALDRVCRALAERAPGFIRLAEDAGEADLQVAVGDQEDYEILDHAGSPVHLRPQLAISQALSVPRLLGRLDHLARYQTIAELENPQPHPYFERFEVRIPDRPEPGVIEVAPREAVRVEIFNGSPWELSIAVLDLRPDWSIEIAWPPRDSLTDHTLGPEECLPLTVHGWLPDGFNAGTDIFKVFATRGTASFDWLRMPVLEKPLPARRGAPKGVLGQLFTMMAGHAPAKRKLYPSEFPDKEWIVRQVTVRVARQNTPERPADKTGGALAQPWGTIRRGAQVRR